MLPARSPGLRLAVSDEASHRAPENPPERRPPRAKGPREASGRQPARSRGPQSNAQAARTPGVSQGARWSFLAQPGGDRGPEEPELEHPAEHTCSLPLGAGGPTCGLLPGCSVTEK